MDATIPLNDLAAASTQTDVAHALRDVRGIRSIRFEEAAIVVLYDPLDISEYEIEQIIRRSGHLPGKGQAHRDSPFAES